MPGFNRKGPEGEGPMTGRKMGRCTNFGAALKDSNCEDAAGKVSSDENGFGRGSGRGRGWGRGGGGGRGLRNRNRFGGGA